MMFIQKKCCPAEVFLWGYRASFVKILFCKENYVSTLFHVDFTAIYYINRKAPSELTKTSKLVQLPFTFLKTERETLEKGMKYVQSHKRRSGVFIVSFEHISYLFLVFLFLPSNK